MAGDRTARGEEGEGWGEGEEERGKRGGGRGEGGGGRGEGRRGRGGGGGRNWKQETAPLECTTPTFYRCLPTASPKLLRPCASVPHPPCPSLLCSTVCLCVHACVPCSRHLRLGVAVVHLPSGQSANVRAGQQFPLASVAKLPLLFAAAHALHCPCPCHSTHHPHAPAAPFASCSSGSSNEWPACKVCTSHSPRPPHAPPPALPPPTPLGPLFQSPSHGTSVPHPLSPLPASLSPPPCCSMALMPCVTTPPYSLAVGSAGPVAEDHAARARRGQVHWQWPHALPAQVRPAPPSSALAPSSLQLATCMTHTRGHHAPCTCCCRTLRPGHRCMLSSSHGVTMLPSASPPLFNTRRSPALAGTLVSTPFSSTPSPRSPPPADPSLTPPCAPLHVKSSGGEGRVCAHEVVLLASTLVKQPWRWRAEGEVFKAVGWPCVTGLLQAHGAHSTSVHLTQRQHGNHITLPSGPHFYPPGTLSTTHSHLSKLYVQPHCAHPLTFNSIFPPLAARTFFSMCRLSSLPSLTALTDQAFLLALGFSSELRQPYGPPRARRCPPALLLPSLVRPISLVHSHRYLHRYLPLPAACSPFPISSFPCLQQVPWSHFLFTSFPLLIFAALISALPPCLSLAAHPRLGSWQGMSVAQQRQVAERVEGESRAVSVRDLSAVEEASLLLQRAQGDKGYRNDSHIAAAMDNRGSPADMAGLLCKLSTARLLPWPRATALCLHTMAMQVSPFCPCFNHLVSVPIISFLPCTFYKSSSPPSLRTSIPSSLHLSLPPSLSPARFFPLPCLHPSLLALQVYGQRRLPYYLPPATTVLHKTGSILGTVNAAGIIPLPRPPPALHSHQMRHHLTRLPLLPAVQASPRPSSPVTTLFSSPPRSSAHLPGYEHAEQGVGAESLQVGEGGAVVVAAFVDQVWRQHEREAEYVIARASKLAYDTWGERRRLRRMLSARERRRWMVG
ncbi:unnamed protein product [Closterium sp. Naga37s-1]|nr:unnamed protein product [Closterium sp. Naga37s-1]